MKKIFLFLLFSLLTHLTYAQSNEMKKFENTACLTEFTSNTFVVKARTLLDLEEYNWAILEEIYKNTPSKNKIKITIYYDENGNTKIDGNDLFQEIECHASDLKNTIKNLNIFSNSLRG